MPHTSPTLVAVDIGNSRIKLGRFEREPRKSELPGPTATLELLLKSRAGEFDPRPLAAWCEAELPDGAEWLISSVHRGATEQLLAATAAIGRTLNTTWPNRQLDFADVPLVVEVDAPERVGMDRLMGAVAADRLRTANRPAIVVDVGTAIKVGLLSEVGAFVGGAILPGMAMSARALEEQTDALPHVAVEWHEPPRPLGKSTVPAIEAGIFWGAVGAVRELVGQFGHSFSPLPEVFVTGGGSKVVAEVLAEGSDRAYRHVPHLVLSGVAIVDAAKP
jgi:type III pantothenate kinase